MKAKARTIAGVCALAISLALPAGSIAAPPTVTHENGSDSGSFTICGLDLTYDFHTSGVEAIKTSGLTLDTGEFRSVWTNPATGKSIVIHGTGLGTTGAPIDNGDGTISFVQSDTGNYIVKAANGAPISLDAGRVTVRVTVNAATGDLVSVELLSLSGTSSGPPADSSCDSIIAALT